MQIKFIVGGASSAFGGFAAGDMLRTSPEMAKHLVEEIKVAEYVGAPEATPEPKPTKGKK